MKVCIVSLNIVPFYVRTPESKFGGAETQAGFLARAFESAGAKVVFVVADKKEQDVLPYAVENAFSSSDGLPGARFLPRMSGIVRALERADADVYYQRNAGSLTGIASWFSRKHRRVFVYGAGSDTDFSLREVIMSGGSAWRDRLLYMYGLRRADGVVVQNEQQAAACRAALGREPRIIPNGIVLSTNHVPGTARQPVVVWVGALRDVKQPGVFLDLARRLPNMQFVMVGGPVDSDPGHAARIRDDARSIPNLTLTGRVSQDEVTRILGGASVLVNTSKFEGFPNAFLEAWAAGVPIVSLVDVDDILSRERVGIVCESVEAIARELPALMNDPARLQTMGERARDLVKSRYGADVLGPQYMQYFDELLSSRR